MLTPLEHLSTMLASGYSNLKLLTVKATAFATALRADAILDPLSQ